MKKAILIATLVLGLSSVAFAEQMGPVRAHQAIYNGSPGVHQGVYNGAPPQRIKTVTPYGDFCPSCSVYGVRYKHQQVRHDKAVEAMRTYFLKKGYQIGNVRGLGRFIRVDVYKDKKLVDRVVFDRKTGRIRSIY